MDVSELNNEELEELRATYFNELLDQGDEILEGIESQYDIPMSNVIAHYEGIYFVEEDFWCNIN